MGQPFRLYNTLNGKMEDFTPIVPGEVGIYVCGMTVYDDCHIGHARAMVTFDSFSRYLRYRGWNVNFVRNFTDVDDKIIARANEAGEDPLAWAQRYIDRFHEDMDNLGLAAPDHEPRVSTSIDDIQALIAKLVDKDHAYAADGSVWFAVESDPNYGQLSNQKLDELRSADADNGKRHPGDFALWKAKKEGEPSWDSPWGPGRPGWHIECSAMAWKTLGTTIDIHGGGLDLVFPHHENEVAQSECGHGCRYANTWMHNGLLTMESGQKMGKSLGNAIGIRDILSAYPAEVLRLYYLQNHYRSPLPWGDTALDEALSMLARLYDAREVAEQMGGGDDENVVAERLGADAQQVLKLSDDLIARLQEALDEDFNTSKALGLLFELARAINRLSNHKKAKKQAGPVVAAALEHFRTVAEMLGLMQLSTADFQAQVKAKRLPKMGVTTEQVDDLLAQRRQARADKDWAKADAIRDQLTALKIVVMDTATGSDWRISLN